MKLYNNNLGAIKSPFKNKTQMNSLQSNALRFSVTMPSNVDSYDNLIFEVYTNPNFREKYYYPARTGEKSITIDTSPNIAKILVSSKRTAKMNGSLYYELKGINDIDTANETTLIGKTDTGIVITSLASANDY